MEQFSSVANSDNMFVILMFHNDQDTKSYLLLFLYVVVLSSDILFDVNEDT